MSNTPTYDSEQDVKLGNNEEVLEQIYNKFLISEQELTIKTLTEDQTKLKCIVRIFSHPARETWVHVIRIKDIQFQNQGLARYESEK
jgi:hypothetical protein